MLKIKTLLNNNRVFIALVLFLLVEFWVNGVVITQDSLDRLEVPETPAISDSDLVVTLVDDYNTVWGIENKSLPVLPNEDTGSQESSGKGDNNVALSKDNVDTYFRLFGIAKKNDVFIAVIEFGYDELLQMVVLEKPTTEVIVNGQSVLLHVINMGKESLTLKVTHEDQWESEISLALYQEVREQPK